MATTEKLMAQYGVAWFGFDEPSGNVIDKLGNGYTGTVTGATRVDGWDGEGHSMGFNGTSNMIAFNNKILPLGEKTIGFKFKTSNYTTTAQNIMETYTHASDNGTGYGIRLVSGVVSVNFYTATNPLVTSMSISTPLNINLCDGKWHSILFSWTGKIEDSARLYLDDELVSVAKSNKEETPSNYSSNNLNVGAMKFTSYRYWYNGQLDDMQFYNKVLSPSNFTQKRLVVKTTDNKNIVLLEDRIREIPNLNEDTILKYGGIIKEVDSAIDRPPLDFTKLQKKYETVDISGNSTIKDITPVSVKDLLGDEPQVIYYTDSDTSQIAVETGVDPYSIYDHISESPTVVAYTEATDDIIVSTNTESFDIYDEFGDSVEVLYYTDDKAVNEADLILEANWSPIDELEGDFEVVTWTDETHETAQRILEMAAIPKPQFIYKVSSHDVSNGIEKIVARDLSQYIGKSPVRLLFTSDNSTWFTWTLGSFVQVSLDNNNIISQGLSIEEATSLSKEDLAAWTLKTFNIGVFLADDIRDKNISKVSDVGFDTKLFSGTSRISDANFYILNTTATINVDLSGLTLTGQVDDADMTRVQYRVILNDSPYYPADGTFTPLSSPPLNIDLTIQSSEVKIGDWNTIKVEFKDYFGTTDYWEAQFIGKYAGIMFTDTDGNYYSSDVGQVLQYLDFGQILTGQITPSYEVKLRNDYGFDVKNVELAINTSKFAQGLEVQLAKADKQFRNETRLMLGDLVDEEETSFFIRMTSSVTAVPNDNKEFNIIVTAQRVI